MNNLVKVLKSYINRGVEEITFPATISLEVITDAISELQVDRSYGRLFASINYYNTYDGLHHFFVEYNG